MEKIFTSESVNIGHPDKTCDIIADAFLDAALLVDPKSQMAVECSIKNNKLFVYGEATTKAKIDYKKIARDILKNIGYKNKFKIILEISKQSPDIFQAVEKEKICANDQGFVFGFATNETKEFMPLPHVVATQLMKAYEKYRLTTKDFFADAKSQVSVRYENGKPKYIDTALISVSHTKSCDDLQNKIMSNVVLPEMESFKKYVNKKTKYIINPSGKFTIWGSFADSGCVGRKIVVDSYGSASKVGGGCFSSKNATKVDRSGAYYARYVAKNLVSNKFCDMCEISVAYGIGLEKPLAVNVETFGTEKLPLSNIYQIIEENFDFSPDNIIKELDLLKPIYKQTACYGHFGNPEFPWEKLKKIKHCQN